MTSTHIGDPYAKPMRVGDATYVRTDGRDERFQDQGENTYVPNPCGAVDKPFQPMIDPTDDTWKPSDMAFQMYLDAITPETFSSWEWRVYQHARLRITKGN